MHGGSEPSLRSSFISVRGVGQGLGPSLERSASCRLDISGKLREKELSEWSAERAADCGLKNQPICWGGNNGRPGPFLARC